MADEVESYTSSSSSSYPSSPSSSSNLPTTTSLGRVEEDALRLSRVWAWVDRIEDELLSTTSTTPLNSSSNYSSSTAAGTTQG